MRRLSPQMSQAATATAEPGPKSEEQRVLRESAGISFEILNGGEDARFLNGRYSHQKVSELVKMLAGRDYLGQIWRMAPLDLKRVMQRYFSD